MIFYTADSAQYEPQVINFPDGTPKIDTDDIAYPEKLRITWRYEGEEELFRLVCTARSLQDRFPDVPMELYLPYLPNARMDRVHAETEVFTLKYFCEIINSLGFSKVYVLDVHSNVGIALLDRGVNLQPTAYIRRACEMFGFDPEKDAVFFPDEGSCKRYTSLFPDCSHIAFGIKKRDWATGKITGLDVCGASVEGRRVLIVDDICAYGGTVYHSANKLEVLGCGEIYVFFTHCEDSIAKGKLFGCGRIKKIYTTNSLCTLDENDKLTIIDCLKGELL